jgi:hypothetical protein
MFLAPLNRFFSSATLVPISDIYSPSEHIIQPSSKENVEEQQKKNSSYGYGKGIIKNIDDHHVILNHTKSAEQEEQRIENLKVKYVEYDVQIPLFALVFTTANSNGDSANTRSILQNSTFNRLDSTLKKKFQNPTQKYVHMSLNFSISTPLSSRRQEKMLTTRRSLQQMYPVDEIVATVDGRAYYTGVSAPTTLEGSIIEEAFMDAESSIFSDGFITRTVLVLNPKFDAYGHLVRPRRVKVWLLVIGLVILKFVFVVVCLRICKRRRHNRRLRAEIQKRYSSNNALDDDDFSFCDTDSDVETISMGDIEVSPSLRSVDSFWRKKIVTSTGTFGSEAFRKATHKSNLGVGTNSPIHRRKSLNQAEGKHSLDDFSFAPVASVSQLGLSMNFSQDEYFNSAYDDDSNSASTNTTNREIKARLEADQDRYSEISTSIRESIEEMESNIANLEKSIGGFAIEGSIAEDDSIDMSHDTTTDEYSLSSTCALTGV